MVVKILFVQRVVETFLGYSEEETGTVIKYLMAREFGFTPKQVEEMSIKDIKAFLKLLEVEKKINKVRSRWPQ